jgi:hypothetical protein
MYDSTKIVIEKKDKFYGWLHKNLPYSRHNFQRTHIIILGIVKWLQAIININYLSSNILVGCF